MCKQKQRDMYKILINRAPLSRWNTLEEAKKEANRIYNDYNLEFNMIQIVKFVKKKSTSSEYMILVNANGVKNGKLTFTRPVKY